MAKLTTFAYMDAREMREFQKILQRIVDARETYKTALQEKEKTIAECQDAVKAHVDEKLNDDGPNNNRQQFIADCANLQKSYHESILDLVKHGYKYTEELGDCQKVMIRFLRAVDQKYKETKPLRNDMHDARQAIVAADIVLNRDFPVLLFGDLVKKGEDFLTEMGIKLDYVFDENMHLSQLWGDVLSRPDMQQAASVFDNRNVILGYNLETEIGNRQSAMDRTVEFYDEKFLDTMRQFNDTVYQALQNRRAGPAG